MSIEVKDEEGSIIARVVKEQSSFLSGHPYVAVSLGVGAVQSTLLSGREAEELAHALMTVAREIC